MARKAPESPQKIAADIYDEFMLESAVVSAQEGHEREATLAHIDKLLDLFNTHKLSQQVELCYTERT